MPFGIPGVVLALALIRTYARLGGAIVYSPWMLAMACTVIGLPCFYRPLANALSATDIKVLTEAALTLGALASHHHERNCTEYYAWDCKRFAAGLLFGLYGIYAR